MQQLGAKLLGNVDKAVVKNVLDDPSGSSPSMLSPSGRTGLVGGVEPGTEAASKAAKRAERERLGLTEKGHVKGATERVLELLSSPHRFVDRATGRGTFFFYRVLKTVPLWNLLFCQSRIFFSKVRFLRVTVLF